jgi:hypothetical protein
VGIFFLAGLTYWDELLPCNAFAKMLYLKIVKLLIFVREEQSLWVFENMVLRRISRPKGDELIRGWSKLQNEEEWRLLGCYAVWLL